MLPREIVKDGSSPPARGTPGRTRPVGVLERFIPACAGNTGRWTSRACGAPVHPRLRGEHASYGERATGNYGSSPPARGTPRRRGRRSVRRRFIPACAGNTWRRRYYRMTAAVHPRLRGEHESQTRYSNARNGSSPPARGTRGAQPWERDTLRFIPACAGNTLARSRLRRRGHRAVHPRLRGEHKPPLPISPASGGSSPPARGPRQRGAGPERRRRFIPACAGNTIRQPPYVSWPAVHPRLRGEHHRRAWLRHPGRGSSPPARGTPRRVLAGGLTLRFIPACAGNTKRPLSQRAFPTVHPRLRGEHGGVASARHRWNGSSPPARGTRRSLPARSLVFRFIPACAGNTVIWPTLMPVETVHPRLRGEHRPGPEPDADRAGSSPPARGTHREARRTCVWVRFIPACAGNTKRRHLQAAWMTVHPRLRGEHGWLLPLTWRLNGSSPPARGTHLNP